MFHLACESGEFKLINHCFNNLDFPQFEELIQMKTCDDKTPAQLAEDNRFDQKFKIFEQIHKKTDGNKNTVIHNFVICNQTKELRAFLEYLYFNCLIDTLGFGLKNNDGKTALDIAIQNKNSEAIYLLNHFELNANTKKLTYENEVYTIESLLPKENFLNETKVPIRNLIFQGGGIKGLAYLGALKELTDPEKEVFRMNQIERISGTSAGAITAALLGCGYSLNELEEELNNFDFKEKLMDSDFKDKVNELKNKLLPGAENLLKSFGVINLNLFLWNNRVLLLNVVDKLKTKTGFFPGEEFLKWIDKKISAKLGKNATFKDLQRKISMDGTEKCKYIFLTGSNLSSGKCETFSHLHTPNMIISDAVRISMSIPIFFHPHQSHIRDERLGRIVDPEKGNSLYTDGGLLNNYPKRMFDTTTIKEDYETNFINKESLGFKLVSSDLKSKYETLFNNLQSDDKKIDKFGSFLTMLVNFYYEMEEKNHYDRIKDRERTIYIDDLGISPIEFDIKPEIRLKLGDSGKKAVKDYLQTKNNKNGN